MSPLVSFDYSWTSCKWDQVICTPLCLVFHSTCFWESIMFLFIRSVFFLLLYKVPLFVKKKAKTKTKKHNIFLHSPEDGNKGCLQFGVMKKLLWTFLYVSLHLILLGIHQRVEILNDSVGMYPTLSKTAGVFPRGWKNLSSHEYKWEFYLLHNFSNTWNCQSF